MAERIVRDACFVTWWSIGSARVLAHNLGGTRLVEFARIDLMATLLRDARRAVAAEELERGTVRIERCLHPCI